MAQWPTIVSFSLLGYGNHFRNSCAVIIYSNDSCYVGEIERGQPSGNGRLYFNGDKTGYYRLRRLINGVRKISYLKTCGCEVRYGDDLNITEIVSPTETYYPTEKYFVCPSNGNCYQMEPEQICDQIQYGSIVYFDPNEGGRRKLYCGKIKCFEKHEAGTRDMALSDAPLPLIADRNENSISIELIPQCKDYLPLIHTHYQINKTGQWKQGERALLPKGIAESLRNHSTAKFDSSCGIILMDFQDSSRYVGYLCESRITGIGKFFPNKSDLQESYLVNIERKIQVQIAQNYSWANTGTELFSQLQKLYDGSFDVLLPKDKFQLIEPSAPNSLFANRGDVIVRFMSNGYQKILDNSIISNYEVKVRLTSSIITVTSIEEDPTPVTGGDHKRGANFEEEDTCAMGKSGGIQVRRPHKSGKYVFCEHKLVEENCTICSKDRCKHNIKYRDCQSCKGKELSQVLS